MHRFALPLALLVLLPLPMAQAGSPDSPEIEDGVDDGGLPELDIRRVWVETNDTLNLTFHLDVGRELPAPPEPTSTCSGADCWFTSLTYRIIFRVEDATGAPMPDLAGYNRSYVAYRHGPDGNLTSPVGTYVDGSNTLTLHGQAAATVSGTTITLRIPRSSPAVNMPTGPTPGARIVGLYAYDSPQACSALSQLGCLPLAKPVPGTPPTTSAEWDRAPDAGFANASFPAPPPAAPAPTPRPSPTPAPPAPSPTPAPAPTSETRTLTTVAQASTSAGPQDEPAASRGAPGVAAAPLALALLAVLAMVRSRLRSPP